MRGLRIAFAVAALFSFAASARAQEAVSYYGFSFPQKIGELTRGKVTDLEKTHPGIGYGIQYAGAGARIDIFVYDLGRKTISWDVFAREQKEEFAASIKSVHLAQQRGIYRKVEERDEFETPAVKNPFFRCKAFVIERNDSRVEDSVLCLGGRNEKFFKVRITFSERSKNVADRADKLMREIARATKF